MVVEYVITTQWEIEEIIHFLLYLCAYFSFLFSDPRVLKRNIGG